jgi:hypothetical protein
VAAIRDQQPDGGRPRHHGAGTWNWQLLLGAAFFAWRVQWLIRMLGRHDPQFWQIYAHTAGAHSSAKHPYEQSITSPRILPKLRKFAA